MKRLILHIGTHKTGTTAVQGFLKANAEILERDEGIFYPIYPIKHSSTTLARNGHFLHCQAYLRTKKNSKHVRGDEHGGSAWIKETFAAQVQEHDTILLSDEQLWYSMNTMKGYLGHLQDIIKECGIEQTDIILYIRRQDEYVESYWKQWIKSDMHSSNTLQEHLQSQNKRIMRYLDYARGIERLQKAFGKDHVIVRRYQKDCLVNGDMRYDFADAVGFTITDEYVFLEQTGDPRQVKGNVSLSNNLTEIMRLANLSPTYHEKFYWEFRNAARATTVVSPESARKTSVLSPEERDELLSLFEEGNASLARELFGLEDGVLFDPPDDDIEQWKPDALSLQRDSIVYFTEVIAQMTTRIDGLQDDVIALKRAQARTLKARAKRFLARFSKKPEDGEAEAEQPKYASKNSPRATRWNYVK